MNAAYGRSQRIFELASIALFVPLVAWGLWRLLAATQHHFLLVALLAIPAAWLASDLLSGLAHWSLDTFGNTRTPFIGSALIRPFREHHTHPEEMTRHDFVETHGSSCFGALPVLSAAAIVAVETWTGILAQAVLLFTGFGLLATNQCHKWAHMDESATPRFVRWAQRRWLVLPREHHRVHHTPPFDTHFCVSNGWLNSAFDAVLRAWR
jgi:ubiquitin-conjugating enzyme E2 variant